ncbi:MAG: helix-turn-helix transcriptional regulator [Solirubrobacterales bacterium]
MDRPLAARFATNLRRLRAEADLTQEELAFRAGIHRTQISLMEAGERLPRYETLVRLRGALGVEAADLFEGIAWTPNVETKGGLVVEDAPKRDDDARS